MGFIVFNDLLEKKSRLFVNEILSKLNERPLSDFIYCDTPIASKIEDYLTKYLGSSNN